MLKVTLCCFFVVVASVSAGKAGENGDKKMDITKYQGGPPPTGGCSPMAFGGAHKCCKLPMVFSKATMAGCGKPPGPGGKSPGPGGKSPGPEGKPPPSGGRGKRQLAGGPRGPKGPGGPGVHASHIKCMLKAENLLTATGEVDTAALKIKFDAAVALATPSDPEWPAAFDASLTDCQTKAASAPSTATATTDEKNAMLMMCMRKTLLMNCPTASIDATVATCPATLAALSSCDPFVFPPPRPTGGIEESSKSKAAGKIEGKKSG